MTFLDGFTLFHVLTTLVQIVSGIGLVYLFSKGRSSDRLAAVFLISTAADLVTGFLFPFHGVTPAIVIGLLNVAILVPTVLAWYRLARGRVWRPVFVFGTLALLYFDCLVFIVQSFQKVPGLHALAPVGNEPAVVVSQAILFVAALATGYFCFRALRRSTLADPILMSKYGGNSPV